MAEFDPEAWAHEQAANFDPEKWASAQADPEAPAKPVYSKGRYEPQLGQAPKGNLPPTSTVESLLRGGAHGATMGFADEIAGALKAATRFGSMPRAEDYREGRDAYRAADKRAEASHPVAFNTADVGGTLATAPLAGAVNSAKGAAIAGTKLGALLGLGNSEADLTQGDWTGASVDTAKGAVAGGILGPLGYGISKGAEALGAKAGDVVFNLRSLLGGNPAPRIGRALDALDVAPGSAPNPKMQAAVEQKVIPPEDFPPSAFNKASESAPDAIAKIGRHPRIQVAEKAGIQSAKQGLGAVEDMPWANNPETIGALVDLRRGIIPKGQPVRAGLLGDAIQQLFRGAHKIAGKDENLARALASPEVKAQMAEIIAAGRSPDLSGEAAQALSARALALLGIDATQ